MGRHLICLIDGTMVTPTENIKYQNYSNVYELAYLLQLRAKSEDGQRQTVFYTSGISSQPGTKDMRALATGSPIRAQILDQYTNLCANFEFANANDEVLRDKIYLFGFSRGAMAVRALAGLITEFGLLTPRDIQYAPHVMKLWENNEPRPGYRLIPVPVEFIGIFDSVMGGIRSLKMFKPISFPHNRLSNSCKSGVHILAIDENRRFFQNESWESHDAHEDCAMHQIWMPGAHSDVGGTENAFWGRASLLAMTYFIDTRTALQLDGNWVAEKKSNLKRDLTSRAYSIKQKWAPPPFAWRRSPVNTVHARESYHPIIDHVENTFRYNRKKRYDWMQKSFQNGFGNLSANEELASYFAEFLS